MDKLKESKRELYYQLLKKKDLTDNEIELMYLLSKDKQIQEILNK